MTDSAHRIPELQAGDRLSRDEFRRRYRAMPRVKKAELIEGVVYMPSPVSQVRHGEPHSRLIYWLVHYRARTSGVETGDNATVRLEATSEPQPDAFLRILPERGGQTRTVDGFVEGAPELVAEIAASSDSYDLHDKLDAYRRGGVREYVVWRVLDAAIDWFVLRDGEYERLAASADGCLHSEAFPGLWLDATALLGGDLQALVAAVDRGCATAQHAQFAARLGSAAPADGRDP